MLSGTDAGPSETPDGETTGIHPALVREAEDLLASQPSIRARFLGQFVAVSGGTVVASHPALLALCEVVTEMGLQPAKDVVLRYVPDELAVMVHA